MTDVYIPADGKARHDYNVYRNAYWQEGRDAADRHGDYLNPYNPDVEYWKAAQFACGFEHGRCVLALRAAIAKPRGQ